jgi:hypothetical protein
MDPLRVAGLLPQGFAAPQAKVPIFSFVAPRLVEECLAALPSRAFQQTPKKPAEEPDPAQEPGYQ